MMSAAAIQQMLQPVFPGLLGIELGEVTPERTTATMVVRPDLCTAGGIVHGGALMAFADTLGAVATFVNMPAGSRTTTIESKTNFIGGAAQGTTLRAECLPFHRGRSTMVWQTTIRDDGGKLVAVVSQTQMVLPPAAGAQ